MAQPDRTTVLTAHDLADAVAAVPEWDVAGDRLRRSFEFADFGEAFAFMTRVALLSEKMNHHPNWSNVYNRVDIDVTNHDAGGITEVDVAFCRSVDEIL